MNCELAPVVVVSDALAGGAAAAANNLVDGLAEQELFCERWHFTSARRETSVSEFSLDTRSKRPSFERLIKNVHRSWADNLRRRRHEAAFFRRLDQVRPRILNVHNIHGCGLNHDSLSRVPIETPIIWTLHDCWPFKAEAFEWWNSSRGETESTAVDQPESLARRRRLHFFETRPSVFWVAPSRWMEAEFARHASNSTRVFHIPYGIDCERFAPIHREKARAVVGVDDKRVWIGCGATWASTRKGLDLLPDALKGISEIPLGLLLWGEAPKCEWPAGLDVRVIGRVDSSEKLSTLYSACDLFVCPSRADNLPNTVLESLSCGTPVVGSRAGGISDMVRPGSSGWLFSEDTPSSFEGAIREALANKNGWNDLRQTCRKIACSEYSIALQAKRYLELFTEIQNTRQ